mgnify:CR=1 FL=1
MNTPQFFGRTLPVVSEMVENGDGKPAAHQLEPVEIRKRVAIYTNPKSGRWGSRFYTVFDVTMIILSVLSFFIETIDGIDQSAIRSIEVLTNIFFTAQIALFTWIGTVDPRKMILLNIFYWIDILNVVPFYGGFVADSIGAAPGVKTGLRFIMMLRPLRILKMQVASVQTRVLILALHNSWRALLVPAAEVRSGNGGEDTGSNNPRRSAADAGGSTNRANSVGDAGDGPVLEAGGGSVWRDAYIAMAGSGRVVVGGGCPGVGVAGLVGGGGIAWLSRARGLASESVLAYEVVLPNGTVTRATPGSELHRMRQGEVQLRTCAPLTNGP